VRLTCETSENPNPCAFFPNLKRSVIPKEHSRCDYSLFNIAQINITPVLSCIFETDGKLCDQACGVSVASSKQGIAFVVQLLKSLTDESASSQRLLARTQRLLYYRLASSKVSVALSPSRAHGCSFG
jgi:hypothetical protein